MKPIDIIKEALEELNEYFHESGKEQLEEEQIELFAKKLYAKLPKLDRDSVSKLISKHMTVDGLSVAHGMGTIKGTLAPICLYNKKQVDDFIADICKLTSQPKYNTDRVREICTNLVDDYESLDGRMHPDKWQIEYKTILNKAVKELSPLPEQSDNEKVIAEGTAHFKNYSYECFIGDKELVDISEILGESLEEYSGTKVQLILKQIK